MPNPSRPSSKSIALPRGSSERVRAFKTIPFAKSAKKRDISDAVLRDALEEVIAGKADDLGGGVFKKRLNLNLDRAIIVAKGGQHWIFAYCYQKASRSNIDAKDLEFFRKMANYYASLTATDFEVLLSEKRLLEIANAKG